MDILGLLSVPNWLVYTIAFITVAYVYYTWHFRVLSKLGIPGPKPYPILGNMGVFFKHGFTDAETTLIRKYGKIVGYYFGRQPRIAIGDVDFLRKVLIKDFPNFQDRDKLPLRGALKTSIFDARDEFWRNLRHVLTPAFTTGKLKQMISLIHTSGNRLVENIGAKSELNEEFDIKEYCGAFTMEVIASTAFGWRSDAQKDKKDPFVHHVLKLLDFEVFTPWVLVIFLTPFVIPVLEMFGIDPLPNDTIHFFSSIVKDTLKERRQGIGNRVDFLQLMLDAEQHLQDADDEIKEELKAAGGHTSNKKAIKLTEDDIIAQSIFFIVAGYDTTANTMSFLLYELAINQHIQDKLYDEICEVAGSKDPTYEDLHKLNYMEMCINETLRVYPPVSTVDRVANEDYEYKGVKIPKGTVVTIPIRALHIDPEGWQEPEKFDPKRFTPEAKASRDSMYFLPFGLGPRQCIGMRLALLEMKLTLVKLLRKYRIVTCDKTEIPIKLKKTFLICPKNGIWVKAETRD